MDRIDKVIAALKSARVASTPLDGVKYALGISKVSGSRDVLIVFQENSEMLVTDNVRQTRTIGVRLIALSKDAPRSKVIVRAAVTALEAAQNIRVFDVSGISVELEDELPAPEGMFVATQLVSVR